MHLPDMGQYGLYVWGSYGIAVLGYGALIVMSLLAARRAKS